MGRKPIYATQRKYQAYIDIIMEDLGLTGKVFIDWSFKPLRKISGNAILYGNTDDLMRYGEITIASRNSHRYTLLTIMHELKHIQQYYTGRLQNSDGEWNKKKTKWLHFSLWDGERVRDYSNARPAQKKEFKGYLDSPWEVDARAYEDQLERLFPKAQLPEKRIFLGAIGNVKIYKVKG